MFSWSSRTLTAGALRLFALLGLHPGPDIGAAAAASLAGLPESEAMPLLAELTRANLLTEHSQGRYSLHDLLRAYTASLQVEVDHRAALRRVLDHYLHTAHAASFRLHPQFSNISLDAPRPGSIPRTMTDRAAAMAWFTAEHAVLLAAIPYAAENGSRRTRGASRGPAPPISAPAGTGPITLPCNGSRSPRRPVPTTRSDSEIYGWSGIAVQVMDSRHETGLVNGNMGTVWIHDNYIHHNQRYRHEGYGIQTADNAYALIERNVLDLNRHALESSGAPETGYLAYNNLLGPGGGQNSQANWTHQFDVHGTQDCGGKDAYCGQAGQYFDYRYNTLLYTEGDVIKVRGEPTTGADVTQNVFVKAEGSSAISQTEGVNLHAWDNQFNVTVTSSGAACDFDGNGQDDTILTTGTTWWFRSAATGYQFYYLHTSPRMANQLLFGDSNADGLCDVTVDGWTLFSRRVPGPARPYG